ncbi:MAG TPA: transcriptional regulator [Treponema sp.]|jgi:putative transcriptional regulator|nr:helix-turn-helix transcriptional regulator [Treponema sp.]HAK68728.1 transcriptional regulator [Treponema sp.]HBB43362.1 transcriptional regulator [Treponema sp.]HCA19253.1 transcriptional regulator [Treponema sp.]
MAVIVNLDVMLAKRKMKVGELADKIGITIANLSILKNGKAKAVRFETLNKICGALDCQVGDILEYKSDDCQPGGNGIR